MRGWEERQQKLSSPNEEQKIFPPAVIFWWMSQFDKPEESGSSNVVKGREKEWMTLRWNQYLLPR